MFKWYIWASIGGGALILLIFICCICCCCCCRRKKGVQDKNGGNGKQYQSLPSDEENAIEKTEYNENKVKQSESLTYYVAPPSHKAIDRVAHNYESGAESSLSDFDSDIVSVSAYGDLTSSFSTSSFSPTSVSIQTSLIYSRDARYVAGKIVLLDGLVFDKADRTLNEVKVHVVMLPMRKYALKTDWYKVEKNRSKLDEYFKFKFKKIPSEGSTMLRFRVYGRRNALSKSHCLGECFVNLREIVTSRGGLTIWRKITKGAAEPIIEE